MEKCQYSIYCCNMPKLEIKEETYTFQNWHTEFINIAPVKFSCLLIIQWKHVCNSKSTRNVSNYSVERKKDGYLKENIYKID